MKILIHSEYHRWSNSLLNSELRDDINLLDSVDHEEGDKILSSLFTKVIVMSSSWYWFIQKWLSSEYKRVPSLENSYCITISFNPILWNHDPRSNRQRGNCLRSNKNLIWSTCWHTNNCKRFQFQIDLVSNNHENMMKLEYK